MEGFHFRPVNFRPEMMFGVIAVVEKQPVVDLAVTAHAPGDRFVGIGTVVPEVSIQITEAMAEINEREKEEENVAPVNKNSTKSAVGKSGQLDVSPK